MKLSVLTFFLVCFQTVFATFGINVDRTLAGFVKCYYSEETILALHVLPAAHPDGWSQVMTIRCGGSKTVVEFQHLQIPTTVSDRELLNFTISKVTTRCHGNPARSEKSIPVYSRLFKVSCKSAYMILIFLPFFLQICENGRTLVYTFTYMSLVCLYELCLSGSSLKFEHFGHNVLCSSMLTL